MAEVSGPWFTSSETTKLLDMSSGCAQITNLDLSNFNTKFVQCMDGMFEDCKKLTKSKLIKKNSQRKMFFLRQDCFRDVMN